MDIAAWKARYTQDPTTLNEQWTTTRSAIAAEQRDAVWAWIDEAPAWQDAAPGPLQGVPFAIKDLFHLGGVTTCNGGKLHHRKPRQDGALVAALRAAGAVPVAKVHLHEYAYGLTGENPHFGHITHPRFPERTAGGSSSGSAAAVAAGAAPFALGTDTGGSLRVPAAYCGIYSWRETPHHPWIADATPLAPSFDTAGWLAGSARDIRLLNTALRGAFPAGVGTAKPKGTYVDSAALGVEMEPSHREALRHAAEQLGADDASSAGARDLVSHLPDCNQAYSVLQSTDAYAVHQSTLDAKRADYGEVVWQRIDRGRRWTAREVERAKIKVMTVRLAFARYFATHDYFVMPVAPGTALPVAGISRVNRDSLLDLTTPVSLAGLPTLTVPVPLPDGLSLGLQVVFPRAHTPALDWVLDRCNTCFDPENSS